MSLRLCDKRVRFTAALVFLLAAVINPLSHRFVVAATDSPDLSDFALPDGTLPPICSQAGSEDAPVFNGTICEACLLISAPGLLAGACDSGEIVRVVTLALFPVSEAMSSTLAFAFLPLGRGPPGSAPA